MTQTARPLAALTQTPVLETERLILRAPGQADMAAMLGFLRSDRAQFYGGPFNASGAWHLFAAYTGQWVFRGYGMFAVVLRGTDETIGMVGPYHPEFFNEPEMCWLLCDARHEGKGYVSEAVRVAMEHYFATTNADSIMSLIAPANKASQAVARRLGAVIDPNTPSPSSLPGTEVWRCYRGTA